MRSSFLRFALVLPLAACALAARAQVAYSNLATAPTLYSDRNVYVVLQGQAVYARFFSSATGVLASFSGAVNKRGGGTPVAYALNVFADGPNETLGALLASYPGASTGVNAGGGTSALSTVTPASGLTLKGGTAYWVGIAPSATVDWNINTVGERGRFYFGDTTINPNRYSSSLFPAFSVTVTPVPEPGTFAALGLGALGLMRRRKRA